MEVQSGITELTTGTVRHTLDTPVPVGQSFVIWTVRSNYNISGANMVQVRLDTIVDEHYTEIAFYRLGVFKLS